MRVGTSISPASLESLSHLEQPMGPGDRPWKGKRADLSELRLVAYYSSSMRASVFFLLLGLASPALAQNHGPANLLKGAIYYDSELTLKEANALETLKNNDEIVHLIRLGHISPPTLDLRPIIVFTSGPGPNDPAEFAFLGNPTTFWTITKFLAYQEPLAVAPKPTPTPVPEQLSPDPGSFVDDSPTPAKKRAADDPGRKIWHMVNGERKWYYEKYGPRPTATSKPVPQPEATRPGPVLEYQK